jgi:hypothetical protein
MMPASPSRIYLFAHQDDEVFVLPRIRQDIAEGREVNCVFLTGGRDSRSQRRRDESLRVLTKIGLRSDGLWFVGDELEIPDGRLIENAARATVLLRQRWVRLSTVDTIYVPAWEGGHHDHDACCWIGSELAIGCSSLPEVLQFPLYNGEGLPSRFYRVVTPLRRQRRGARRRRISFADLRAILVAILAYRSQRVAWAGLAPLMLLTLLMRRAEILMPLDRASLKDAPHPGALLYERWNRMAYAQFRKCLAVQEEAMCSELERGMRDPQTQERDQVGRSCSCGVVNSTAPPGTDLPEQPIVL